MYRFLLRPRWIGLALAVAVMVAVFVQLAQWQLHRLDDRRAVNAVIAGNTAARPRPVDAVLAPGRPVPPAREWLQVTARGRYDRAHEILVRYRHLEGEPGFNVLTPLVTDAGTAVLINRGWVPGTGSTGAPTPPAPPAGEVAVVGRLRPSEAGRPDLSIPSDGQVRFISAERIAPSLPYPVDGGYLELVEQRPAQQGDRPYPLPRPELSEGPHLAYAIQWYLFAVIAVGGLGFLAFDEAHAGRFRQRLRSTDRRPPPGRRAPKAPPRARTSAGPHS